MNEPLLDFPEIHPDVDFWLNHWARSCRIRPASLAKLDFPDRSKPFIGGGESQRTEDFDRDQWESVVETNCQTMDALIESLPPAQACAVRHVYAGDCFRFPRNNLFALLQSASDALLIGMRARAVI